MVFISTMHTDSTAAAGPVGVVNLGKSVKVRTRCANTTQSQHAHRQRCSRQTCGWGGGRRQDQCTQRPCKQTALQLTGLWVWVVLGWGGGGDIRVYVQRANIVHQQHAHRQRCSCQTCGCGWCWGERRDIRANVQHTNSVHQQHAHRQLCSCRTWTCGCGELCWGHQSKARIAQTVYLNNMHTVNNG